MAHVYRVPDPPPPSPVPPGTIRLTWGTSNGPWNATTANRELALVTNVRVNQGVDFNWGYWHHVDCFGTLECV